MGPAASINDRMVVKVPERREAFVAPHPAFDERHGVTAETKFL